MENNKKIANPCPTCSVIATGNPETNWLVLNREPSNPKLGTGYWKPETSNWVLGTGGRNPNSGNQTINNGNQTMKISQEPETRQWELGARTSILGTVYSKPEAGY